MKVPMERMEVRRISEEDLRSPARKFICSIGHYAKASLISTEPLTIQLDCEIPLSWGNRRLECQPAQILVGIIHFIKGLVPLIPSNEWTIIPLKQSESLTKFSFLLTPSTPTAVSEVRMRRWPIFEEGRMEEVELPFITE